MSMNRCRGTAILAALTLGLLLSGDSVQAQCKGKSMQNRSLQVGRSNFMPQQQLNVLQQQRLAATIALLQQQQLNALQQQQLALWLAQLQRQNAAVPRLRAGQ